MDVIKVLQSKNRCLQKLVDLSDVLLANEGQTEHFHDELDNFIRKRDSILKALELYDNKVTEVIRSLSLAERTPDLISRVQSVLNEKDRLIQTIILRDNELTLRIEARKKKLQEDLLSSRRSHELAGKFKSTWVSEPGEGFDTTL
jgi:vacuolar-type H+-ATPase subunit I/STV1